MSEPAEPLAEGLGSRAGGLAGASAPAAASVPARASPASGASGPAGPAGPDRTVVRLRPIESELAVSRDDPWSEAGRHVIGVHLARVRAAIPGTLEAADPEPLHVMRVSARRMRAAWWVFRDAYERAAVRRYRAELAEVGHVLGMARDLDVQVGLLRAHLGTRPHRDTDRLAPILAEWEAEREACQAEVAALLRSPRFATLLLELEEFARTEGFLCPTLDAPASPPVRAHVGTAVWTAYEAVLRFDGDVRTLDPGELHAMRIAVKRLRYTLEFVRGPLDPTAGALLRRVVALQDCLGDIRDSEAAAVRVDDLAFAGPDLTTSQWAAAVRFERALHHRSAAARRRLPRAWAGVRGPRFRALLGSALVALYVDR